MHGRNCSIACLILILGLVNGASAQVDTTPDRVARLISESAILLGQTTQLQQYDLTLDDAIQLALDRNLDIAVQRINPQVVDLSVAQQLAFYRPTVAFGLNSTSQRNPSSTQLDGGLVTQTDTANYDLSLTQPVQWGGGDFAVGFNNNRRESNSFFSSFNPSFRSVFFAQYNQPLMRGLSIDFNRQQLQVTRINRDISDIDLRQTITNTVANVRNAYWELLYAVGSVRVQQQALDLAEQLVRNNRTRVAVGTLAPIDIVQAQSEAATRRQTLAQAQQALRTAELTLKSLIVDGTQDELWTVELNPVDQPDLSQPPIDIEGAVRTALDQRTDLARANRQQEINRLNVRGLRNNTLPALDLVAAYQLQGQGGDFLVRGGELGGDVGAIIPGGYRDALDQIVDARFPTWTVGIQLSYPLGTSSEEAALERARLQVRQTEAQLRQIELGVATEVTNAALQITSIQERIAAATVARELGEQ